MSNFLEMSAFSINPFSTFLVIIVNTMLVLLLDLLVFVKFLFPFNYPQLRLFFPHFFIDKIPMGVHLTFVRQFGVNTKEGGIYYA